ncbi:hypothetical protein FNF27_05778 [Cafeteria roenbergensis]|uniref:PH domain-containing protein n=1 Tax=Cafeteria roenbergensis TaxID=33653 RepID=A0A5A8CKK7_CAFRO|nr:hypothetical protein FNF29_03031 [Cafeteria roenbergensis]KAA0163491.1 hypothetical protein FNF31_02885 [Cafeteria roenbergensis]KAA0165920.1 hypothetical protein FNF28_03302 [Cafeteria roenbergensis]KAA0172678.1 hypothetical protein FNF27_05778 [Cafeteria roenbergensis]|eukprot:KAA0153643.1 hypothetical protein FNF29_03031 [Cafeteria roenbergensis]
MPSSSRRPDVPWESIEVLQRGAPLLKFGRQGEPHFRDFRVTRDCTKLTWFSPKKNADDCQVVLSECRLVLGQATRVFLKQSSDGIRMLNLSLSLLYDAPGGGGAGAAAGAKAAIRSLDVVCKSGAEFRLWSVGLAYLVQGPPPPAALAAHRAAVHAREERRTLWAALRRQVDAATGGFPGTLPWEVLAGPACRAEAAAAARAAGPFEDEAVAALRLPMATVPASLATASLTPSLAGAMLPTGFAEVVGGGAGGSRGRGNEIRLALRKARRGSNDVFAWGEGAWGQLGLGDDRDRESAQLLPLLLGRAVRQVAAGAEHTVAITDALEAFAWGSGSCGRLGTGSSDAAFAPQLLRHPTGEPFRFTKVACGARHSLAVAADGSLWAWGDNSGGQLLLGDRRCRLEPTRVDALSEAGVRAVDIAGGSAHSAVLCSIGRLFVGGRNDCYCLGLGRAAVRQSGA